MSKAWVLMHMLLYIVPASTFIQFALTAKVRIMPSHVFAGWQKCIARVWQTHINGL